MIHETIISAIALAIAPITKYDKKSIEDTLKSINTLMDSLNITNVEYQFIRCGFLFQKVKVIQKEGFIWSNIETCLGTFNSMKEAKTFVKLLK